MPVDDEAADRTLEEAAAAGPLPGVEDEDAAEEAGRDDSETADADSEADDAADDIIPGAISHH